MWGSNPSDFCASFANLSPSKIIQTLRKGKGKGKGKGFGFMWGGWDWNMMSLVCTWAVEVAAPLGFAALL